jgi:hypothetical protein
MSPYSGHEAAAAFGYERIMLIWIIFAVMTGASVFALLWPLGRAGRSRSPMSGTPRASIARSSARSTATSPAA